MADRLNNADTPIDGREAVVDTATAVAGAFFGQLPLNVSFAKAVNIENQANMAMRLKGAENFIDIGSAAGAQTRNASDDTDEKEGSGLAIIRAGFESFAREQQRELEREREEWAHTVSTVGGVSMTGDDWSKLAKRLRGDDDLERRILDAFMTRGMTKEEAKARFDRVADVAEAMQVPPSQRTEAQNELIQRADADPTFKKDVTKVQELSSDLKSQSDLGQSFSSAVTAAQPVAQAVSPQQKPATVSFDASAI